MGRIPLQNKQYLFLDWASHTPEMAQIQKHTWGDFLESKLLLSSKMMDAVFNFDDFPNFLS